MSAWEKFGSTYVEAATSAIPLHRLLIAAAGFLASLTASNLTHLSVAESIVRLNISSLIDLKTGPLAAASIANLLAGVVLALIAWGASRAIVKLTFLLASGLTDLKAKARAATESSSLNMQGIAMSDRQAMIALLEANLEQPRKSIRTLNSMLEICVGLGLGIVIASSWGNMLDVVVGLLLLGVGALLSFTSVTLFLSDYYGHAMYRAQLQGKQNPVINDI